MIGKILKWTAAILIVSTVWIWLPALLITSPLWLLTLLSWYCFIKIFGLGDILQRGLLWLVYFVFLRFSLMRKLTWKTFYKVLATQVPAPEVKLMNSGFDSLHNQKLGEIPREFQDDKYSIRLYQYVATGLGSMKDLYGMHVLEIGSGRGGGLYYVATQLSPTSAVGIDLCESQVDFARKNFNSTNLMFAVGDAEKLPVKDSCVDVVICIESSHCFSDFNRFVSEASRVLVKGGHLFFADLRDKDKLAELDGQFRSSPLVLVKKHDITDHVVSALEKDSARRVELVKNYCPIWLRPLMRHFAATTDSTLFYSLQSRDRKYLAYDLVKPNN